MHEGIRNAMIYRMTVLQMSVAEIAAEMLLAPPELSFVPWETGTLVSSVIDVAVTSLAGGSVITIAEPPPGCPVLTVATGVSGSKRRLCQLLIDAINERRATLKRVTEVLVCCLPSFPQIERGVRIPEVARLCDLHVSSVSRALENKVCSTDIGLIPLKHFLSGFGPGK